ncbi:hypothetical protein HY995_06060 [Candidatus Micrarchaeota archaeon]|nr:hypothetical protein [Candidatus Micrarchaeota archaeon]MBI5177618.1 hypothetical protein [Candidatus Micrarchaeota archaeon]
MHHHELIAAAKSDYASRAQGDAEAGGTEPGDEDLFENYALSRVGINLNYWLFPGLVMHEFSHYILCILAGCRVHEVVWWSRRGGHVMHTRVRGSASVLISLAPLIVNNILAVIFITDGLSKLGAQNYFFDTFLGVFLLWLGFSLAVYAFPSRHDLKMSRKAIDLSLAKRKGAPGIQGLWAALAYPFVYLLHFILMFVIAPFSTIKTLRLVWGLLLIYIISSAPNLL